MSNKYLSEIEHVIIANGDANGKRVWVCDIRWDDFNNKPIRKVRPTYVEVTPSNEIKGHVYYSDSVFLPINKKGSVLKSKIVKLYDNTGYRSYPGVPLKIFIDEYDCKMAFSNMCIKIMDVNVQWVKKQKQKFKIRQNELREMQTDALVSLNK